ncbi:MAG: ATP-binding protein [Myxococcota bacterium]
MSEPRGALHGDGLLRALTEIALEVQRARKVADVLAVAGGGLEGIDFDVAVLVLDAGKYEVRYLSPRADLKAVSTAMEAAHGERHFWDASWMQASRALESTLLVEDLRGAAVEWMRGVGAEGLAQTLSSALKARALVAPLNVGGKVWGVAVFMRDALSQDDAGALNLFSLQLGSALEVALGFERLERRTAELELVHQLAVAGPRADIRALTHRALETVCRSTQSNVGVLHRFDPDSSQYELVGDAYGYQGPLLDVYRRFPVPEGLVGTARPMSLPVSQLLASNAEVASAGYKHLAILPLTIEGKRAGMLTLARIADEPYGENELYSAEILGVQMASQLERARLYDDTNRLYGDLKLSYDELARTQAELVRHERLAALGELAAVMAHEVRNPLGVIFNSLTTLKRLIRLEGDAEMLINIVGEEADRLNRIVGDLLDFVRPYELVKKPIAIEPVVVSAVDSAAQSLTQANVKVVTEFPAELPPFPADAHLLKQALVNLIVNAVQAMPKGGVVTVRACTERRDNAAWLKLDVRDEGVGLTPRAAERIFQPFFTTKATGTGLGLAVVKRIIEAHLGEVAASANEGGVGTTFTVRLPPGLEARDAVVTPARVPAVRAPR